MSTFRTEVPVSKSDNAIDFNSKILSLGSCFAENISEKLTFYKFQNAVNPFGIIFNPISIERIVERIVKKEFFTTQDIFYHNESWHCFEGHSQLNHSNKEAFLRNLNQILESSAQEINELSHCIITFGTSWVYRNLKINQIVANCHKIPQNQFVKQILTVEEISKSIENTIRLLQAINKDIKFIFTISPVRHIKDGFVENNVSKSLLITAVYRICEQQTDATYFPSYEIMMDELRDYRFYADDMLHPNRVAVNYIWGKFKDNFINDNLTQYLDEIENIQKSLHHKPFDENSAQHKDFLARLYAKIEKITETLPHIKF
jgi:hypothetical protein